MQHSVLFSNAIDNCEDAMRTYEIRYVDSDGNLIGAILTSQLGPRQASIFAHAMTLRPYERMEVWEDDALIYERPHRPAPSKPH
jgi:hypothetical protein